MNEHHRPGKNSLIRLAQEAPLPYHGCALIPGGTVHRRGIPAALRLCRWLRGCSRRFRSRCGGHPCCAGRQRYPPARQPAWGAAIPGDSELATAVLGGLTVSRGIGRNPRRTNGGRSSRAALALMAMAGLLAASLHAASPASAATLTLPDMQIQVPTNLISIGTDPTTGHRVLSFTHTTWDAGAGPFEIDPAYNAATGTATFTQAIYNSPSPGVWSLDHTVPLSVTGVFDAPDDYQFPLASFTLNTANSDGSPGPVVATSPKTDYCIVGDTFV